MKPDFKELYSSKTDDEILAQAVDLHSLEPEAQIVLRTELRRRNLTDQHLWPRTEPDEVPFLAQNPAFNSPAKVAGVLILLGMVGLGLSFVIAAAQAQMLITMVLLYVLVWGPIFLAIAWATRRALRNRRSHSVRDQKL